MRARRFFLNVWLWLYLIASVAIAGKNIDPVYFTFEIQEPRNPSQDFTDVDMVVHLQDGWKILHPKDKNPMGIPPSTDFQTSKNVQDCKIIWPRQIRDIRNGDRIKLQITPENSALKSLLNLDIQFSVCKEECRFFQERLTVSLPALLDYQKGETQLNDNPEEMPLLVVIFLGIVGGVILNFMPCVLPVLSLKLMQFTKKKEVSASTQKLQLVATILGIFFSFWALSGLVIAFRMLGHEVGWGLHFQQPEFLMFMVVVMLLFAANLLGLFEFQVPKFLQHKTFGVSQGFFSHFMLGLLATLLATPCSAPFLGTAITYALLAQPVVTWVVFSAMAVGFALPYMMILMSPRFLTVMPKPGVWMIWLRRFMGIGLLGTAVWLGTVWYEIVYFARDVDQARIEKGWEGFHVNKIDSYVSEGYGVFVDVTASWCVTCAANKRLVLSQSKIQKTFQDKGVKKLQADWTRPSADISKYLNRHNRFGIPFNIYYSPKCPKGHVFPEILQVSEIIEVVTQKC